MAINISQAFHRTSANPIDDTLALTKAEMLNVNDNLMPSKYLTVCQDDGQIYLYDKSATPSVETGKFVLFEAGGGGSVPIGTVIPLMGKTPPTNYLTCNGSIHNISDYPKLANFFEQEFGTKNHFGGDGTTTFGVPDLRGEFIRMTGANSHANQGNGGQVGEHQNATTFPYFVSWYGTNPKSGIMGSVDTNLDVQYPDKAWKRSTGSILWSTPSSVVGTSTGLSNDSFIARPTNTSVLFCICARTEETEPTGHEYSTTEKVVGTWVDGKPVYEKSVRTTGTFAGAVNNVLALDNVDEIISMIGTGVRQEGEAIYPLSFCNGITTTDNYKQMASMFYNVANTSISLRMGESITLSKVIITVRYTKNTD